MRDRYIAATAVVKVGKNLPDVLRSVAKAPRDSDEVGM